MENLIESQPKSSDWLTFVHETFASKPTGQFITMDTVGKPIVIEWEKIDPPSPRFNEKIKNSSELLVNTYTQLELEFAQKFPKAAANEYFLKPLAPLFEEKVENIDWELIEEKIKGIFHQFFTTTDFAKYSAAKDIFLFVTAKDKETGKSLGIIQFLISQDYAYGSVKACYFGVMPKIQNKNIDKILMSSIFTLIPTTNRVFLHTRATNEKTIHTYLSWGFKQYSETIANWPDFEYLIEHSTTLQETAQAIVFPLCL